MNKGVAINSLIAGMNISKTLLLSMPLSLTSKKQIILYETNFALNRPLWNILYFVVVHVRDYFFYLLPLKFYTVHEVGPSFKAFQILHNH